MPRSVTKGVLARFESGACESIGQGSGIGCSKPTRKKAYSKVHGTGLQHVIERAIGTTSPRLTRFQAAWFPEFLTILQMFQFRFGPEIRKRLDEGRIDSFVLHVAQFVQREDRPPQIRLNDEIRGEALVRANRDVSKGDTVYVRDLVGVEGFDLHPDERDAGHFTLFCGTMRMQWAMRW